MEHVFSQVPKVEVPRSVFDRSHEHKTTIDAGFLYPILVDEILPGDSVVLDTKIFCRVATLIAPIMDNLYLDTHYFFVPERLVWNHFQRMCGEQDSPDQSTDFTFPVFYTGGLSKASPMPYLEAQDVGSLADYFGIPTGVDHLPYVRCEPFRCYNLIYRDWFMDENLQSSPVIENGDSDDISNYTLLRRGKRKDYFTSALPFAQKGPGVELPIRGYADISGLQLANVRFPTIGGDADLVTGMMDPGGYLKGALSSSGAGSISKDRVLLAKTAGVSPKVNLSNSVTTTINEFREAFQLQKWLERCARSGTRYTELLRGMFGVVSPDARLQRPEYLGGTSTPIDVNVVPQTASTDATSPQANLSAYAVGISHNGDGFSKSFVEHGWLIGLVSIRSNYTYQQGLNRMWSRRTKYDMYWPSFAHLGEQAILNQEIYAQGVVPVGGEDYEDTVENSDDHGVFGYQERHAEYRYFPSLITGKFRSSYAQSLDYWHLSQYFEELPTLGNDFIVEDPPVDRIIAVENEPQFLLDCFFNMKCTRPMPLYAVPGLVDHF